MLDNDEIIEEVDDTELVAESNPILGILASKSANNLAAISAAVSGLLA
jgi:hypothetical protein